MKLRMNSGQLQRAFEPDDMRLLGTLYAETNAGFDAAVVVADEERPDITDLWRSHHADVNTSTTELLEAIAATPEDERTARDKYLFDWHSGEPHLLCLRRKEPQPQTGLP